jgi:4-alpha-glucanotransferase
MSEAAIHALAQSAGLSIDWRDHANNAQRVSTEALQRILAALGLPCDTAEQLSASELAVIIEGTPSLVTATAGQPIDLRLSSSSRVPDRVRVTQEDGKIIDLSVGHGPRGIRLPAIGAIGYHSCEIGDHRITLAVAPACCPTIADIAPNERVWGVAAQVYGLRSSGDCGIGDGAGVVALARKAAANKADVLALSPVHALFAADPNHFSPYSPSSRLFYNPLHADACVVFGEARVLKATAQAGVDESSRASEQRDLIDWPQSTRAKMSIFRRLFEDFATADLVAATTTPLGADFARFRVEGGKLLEDHACFEALHAERLRIDAAAWSWIEWPAQWRDPDSDAVRAFTAQNSYEIAFHCFLQWIADRSLAAAQAEAKRAGMRIGLIADLAIGMSGAGSHAWTRQQDILVGLEIGAPPDQYNAKGQNWGLTTFSPRALSRGGFAPFIATLRACLRHAGGARVDHAMGLLRLWVIPRGAVPSQGAYLAYPIDDLMRLTKLESSRHRAIVIGEDLGTVPVGFRERLTAAGIYGMRVLWFERERNRFAPPQAWSADTAAMTSTHDLPTVAGWWRGTDIEVRSQIGLVPDPEKEKAERLKERRSLWRAFRRAGVAIGDLPAATAPSLVVDAAVKFLAETPSHLTLLPLEDALALEEQPNLPGTIDEHPNWRRRYPGQAQDLLEAPAVRQRIAPLVRRGER